MSRIDEALRALERGSGGARPATPAESPSRTSSATALELYPGEDPAAPSIAVSADPVRRVETAPASVTTTTPTSIPAESEGKLIGPGAHPILVEQYRRLAASLHDVQVMRNVKTVMVTSAVPREGKTLTTLNLALTLSESFHRRVLVVDADLRRPSIHKALDISNARGLTEALRDQGSAIAIVQRSPKLSVLPAGDARSAPLALLTSERMGTLLDTFERDFDWVLIDTPPVGFLPDAQLLARLIQAAVFVIGAGSTPAAVVERAVSALGAECVLGTVLNRVEAGQMDGADYYYGG